MIKEKIEQNLILKLSFDFALLLITFCERLEKKYVIVRQLLKSGTSVDADTMKAQNGENKAAFIHIFKIAAKEAEETQFWLLLCEYSKNFLHCKELLVKIDGINMVIGKIMSSSKRGLPLVIF